MPDSSIPSVLFLILEKDINMNTNDFMSILHQQASVGDNARIRKDKAIMRVVGSWIDKRQRSISKP